MPLSSTVVGGTNFVILAKGKKPIRISDLAVQYPATHEHLLLTPEGERLVQLRIGPFVESMAVIRMRDYDGVLHSYLTNAGGVRISDKMVHQGPGEYYASRYTEGEPELIRLVFEKASRKHVECYEYTMTPGPIYLGTGKRPTFLPFEVLSNDFCIRQSIEP